MKKTEIKKMIEDSIWESIKRAKAGKDFDKVRKYQQLQDEIQEDILTVKYFREDGHIKRRNEKKVSKKADIGCLRKYGYGVVGMKEIIKKVLAEFGEMQANLESEAMQDMITDKIAREIKSFLVKILTVATINYIKDDEHTKTDLGILNKELSDSFID